MHYNIDKEFYGYKHCKPQFSLLLPLFLPFFFSVAQVFSLFSPFLYYSLLLSFFFCYVFHLRYSASSLSIETVLRDVTPLSRPSVVTQPSSDLFPGILFCLFFRFITQSLRAIRHQLAVDVIIIVITPYYAIIVCIC